MRCTSEVKCKSGTVFMFDNSSESLRLQVSGWFFATTTSIEFDSKFHEDFIEVGRWKKGENVIRPKSVNEKFTVQKLVWTRFHIVRDFLLE